VTVAEGYLWVTNVTADQVTRVLLPYGVIRGSYPAGRAPVALAYDGARLWIANRDSRNVTVLRAADGRELMTHFVFPQPAVVLWDGRQVWVANAGDGTVSRRD
jgi:DNA-binding beta-propeller fold protein YncE